MKWRRTSGSGGVDDLRGRSSGGGIPVGRIGGGLGGAGILGIVIALLFTFLGGGGTGFDPSGGLDQLNPTPAATGDAVANGPDPDANLVAFVKFVVEDVQDSWSTAFQQMGRQ